ncbi:MAG: metal-dependent hydrolase [Candidatus Heimdallarchaeaceae archaeon]
MQGGIHLLSGLLLASLWKRSEYKVGAVFGSILPDIDLFIAALAYLFIGDKAIDLHRSFTHSFPVILLFCLLIYVFGIIMRKFHPDKTISSYDFTGFCVGLLIGMYIHVVLDLFYLVKVAIFWPFYREFIGWPLVPLSELSDLALKILQTTDFLTDIFLFIIPMVLSSLYFYQYYYYDFLHHTRFQLLDKL